MLSRFKSAARILLMGDPKKNKRDPIAAITPEEVAEALRSQLEVDAAKIEIPRRQ